MSALTAFHRGYDSRTKRAGQVTRLHILRPELVGKPPNQTEQALCHLHAWGVTNSPRVDVTPFPTKPPTGLVWCGVCIGRAAERLGLVDAFAQQIAQVNR